MSTPSPTHSPPNSVRSRRMSRDWSQQDLADRAGLSRPGISAIEAGRLAPSVTAAMALARALCCTVEELFAPQPAQGTSIEWAIPTTSSHPRYWNANVGGRILTYPIEDDSPQLEWHDGVLRGSASQGFESDISRRTLVVACCDPAAGLLAAEYARQYRFRMIVLRRSSREALELLAAGKVHVAGIHLGRTGHKSQNSQTTRSRLGDGFSLVRVARWEEGLAISARFKMPTLGNILSSKARWVGREEGSGSRQCQDEILRDRPAPRRVAFDHRSVAAAVRCGWADVGPCVRLASEESGLRFLKVAEKDYDLCFSAASETEPRVSALLATIRSHGYRSRLSELPGYSTKHTGEILQPS
jgi:molybdate-binding protein/DNA-binding XRE family transcriptional regulator